MAEPSPWQIVPNAVLDTAKQTDDAQAWGDKQRADLAQQWGDQQRLSVAPASPPTRDDWATGGGSPPAPFAQPAADSSSAVTSPNSAPSAAGDFSEPAADGAGAGMSSTSAAAPFPQATDFGGTGAATATSPAVRTSQFGMGLSQGDAYAACGPAAAIAFAKTYGRNPTVEEAMQLARSVGWTQGSGMAGVASEQAMLSKMGVQTKLEQAVDWNHVAQDVKGGNPVIISTPGHYFYVTGFDPDSGRYEVGSSGTDLKAGSAWMTPREMARTMGNVNGALYADHPLANGPSMAESAPSAVSNWEPITPTPGVTAPQAQDSTFQYNPSDANIPLNGQSSPPAAAQQTPGMPFATSAPKSAQEALDQAGQLTQNLPRPLFGPGGLGAYDPRIGPPGDEAEGRAASSEGGMIDVTGQLGKRGAGGASPTGKALRLSPAEVAARAAAGENPYRLETTPAAGLMPLSDAEALSYHQDLGAQYEALDKQIQALENQLASGAFTSTGVVRPPGTIGWSDAEVVAYAKQNGLNPYSLDGWPHQAGDAQNVAAHRPSVPSTAKQTASQANAELQQLYVQRDQIMAASDHMMENGNATFYRRADMTPEALPWDNGAPTNAAAPSGQAADATQGAAPADSSADAGAASGIAQTPAGAGAISGQAAAAPPAVTARGPRTPAGRPVLSRGGPGVPDNAPRPTMPAPTMPGDMSEALAQSQIQVLVKQARDAGYEDEQIAQIFKNKGASDEQIQNILHPPAAPTVPTSPRPVPPAPQLAPAFQRAAQLSPQDIGVALDRGDVNPLSRDFFYTIRPPGESVGGDLAPTSRGAVPNDPKGSATWLSAGGPVGGRSGPILAIDKSQLDPSLIEQHPNGYWLYRGTIPSSAILPLGDAAPGAQRDGPSLLQMFQDAVRGRSDPATTSPRPVPADAMDRAQQAITRLDAGDESALDELAQLDKQASGSGGAGVAPPSADNPPPPSGGPPAPPAGPTDVPPPPLPGPPEQMFTPHGDAVPSRHGITPDTVQAAHERIDRAIDPALPPNQEAHEQLDQMLTNGAAPDEIARFLSGEVEGHTVDVPSMIRTVRTGSMAGGLTTEGKVALSPIIQTAMRAPVGALTAIVKGRPQDLGAGLQGGLAGLAEGAQDALQTIRYGINYRSALTGGAQGGYGFRPGIDVMGKSGISRALGTAALGLVRTHGAIADVSAGIGRGANAALGASPEAAAEAGQQWALRSGNYGVIGAGVAKAFDQLKSTSPWLDVVGQILVPFYRVGYNTFTQGVERSPLGLVGRLTDIPTGKGFQGDKLANNMFGVGLAAYAFSQAAQGNITGESPQNGAPRWSIRVAGNWVPIRTLGPAGEALAQAAMLYEAARDGRGNVGQIAEKTASEYVAHVYDETWLRSIGDAIGTVTDIRDLNNPRTAGRAGKDLQYKEASYGKSFVPQERLGEQMAGAAGAIGGQPSVGSQPQPQPAGRYQRRP